MENRFAALSGKTVLVTGSTGYIGPQLCRMLAELNCNVIAVSRNSSPELNYENVNFEAVDLTLPNKVNNLFKRVKPEYIFHLAGEAVGSRSLEFVQSTFQSNLVTTVNMLTATAEQNFGKVILAGSMEEPTIVECEVVPSSPYAASKWAASAYAKMFYNLYKTNIVVARLFMTYGPGKQPRKKLLPYVINNILEGNNLKLGNGKRKIDWIYIDDVIEGLLSIAISQGIEGETIDIGSGSLISTREIVEVLQKTMSGKTELHFGQHEERTNEEVKKANIETSFIKIGWKSKTNLDNGLKKTVEWFKQQKQIPNT